MGSQFEAREGVIGGMAGAAYVATQGNVGSAILRRQLKHHSTSMGALLSTGKVTAV
jgi:hypothetical protein